MKNQTKIISWLIIGFFLLTAGWYTVSNIPILAWPVYVFLKNGTAPVKFKKELTAQLYSDGLYRKTDLINLNGLYARLIGKRQLNRIMTLKNGMLTELEEKLSLLSGSMQKNYRALFEFDEYVTASGAHLVYAFFPDKLDLESKLLPDGIVNDIPGQAELTLDFFREKGIDVVDTMPELSGTPADVEKYFYRTDHHWKPIGAFRAYQMIMARLKELYPDEPFDEEMMKIENWTIHEIPDQFLGTRGKRVGIYYGGLDDLQWLTPNHDTWLSFDNIATGTFRAGKFEDILIRDEFLLPTTDFFKTNNYEVYEYANSLLRLRNTHAPSSKRLLIKGDSYMIPLAPLFLMQFREIDVIQPNYYAVSSVKEYIDQNRPDIVLIGQCLLSMFSQQFLTYSDGNDDFLTDERIVLKETSFSVAPDAGSNNSGILYERFENEKYYTVWIPKILVTDGAADGASVTLYDTAGKTVIFQRTFDISYCNQSGGCEWTFQVPQDSSGNAQLLLFAGVRGMTEGVGITYEDVKLYERMIK